MEAKDKNLPIRQFVALAKKRGVDFGKSNPYNRLRYYTKIGLLPNMVRIKSQGHYPMSALERLYRIEKYKKEGWDNKKILKSLKKEKVVIPLDPISKKKWLWYFFVAFFVSLFLIGIVQASMFSDINKNGPGITGSYVMQIGERTVFVYDSKVKNSSKVFVTFTSDYAPASSYHVSSVTPNLGFELSLSSPISQTARFNYWIVE